MLHPDTALRWIGPAIGYGVFVTAPIPRGTVVWVLDALDRVLSPEQLLELPEGLRRQVETYAYLDSRGRYILCWDFARYMNHSCRPATRVLGEAYEIAVRDLAVGDELTCEYATLNLRYDFRCACQAPDCRQVIGPEDLAVHAEAWDAQIAAAFAAGLRLAQPLLPFARPSPADQLLREALAAGREVAVPSCRAGAARASLAPFRRLPDRVDR